VADLTATVEREPGTLAVQVGRLVRFIAFLSTAIGAAVFGLGWLVGVGFWEGLLFGIGMIVANVPEGLLPTVTLALARSAQRMAGRKVLVRRMEAVETLSAVTVICADKTGTLTENRMAVRRAWIPGGTVALDDPSARQPLRPLLAASALCTEAGAVVGPGAEQAVARDPLDAAVLSAARAGGLDPLDLFRAAPRLREVPFDPARRRMTVVTRGGLPGFDAGAGPLLSFTKGAPPEVLARCARIRDGERARPLGDEERLAIAAEADRLASAGHRVVAVAFRALDDGGASAIEVERDLVLLGLLAVFDPPRAGVSAALRRCREAGIRVVMVTGDHGATASAVAREVGLVSGEPEVTTGTDLDRLGDEALRELLRGSREVVFARVLPEQKLRLVKALQGLGEVVAVTGDGVNDAPALRAAHVGIAMGASGTDVARAAADVVLLDDDFASLVAAVEEGRAIFRNIRKFLAYILTSNVPELAPFLAMVVLRIPPALNILQILAVDLGTDMLPALALGAEPPEPGLMRRPPRPRDAPLLDRSLLLRAYLRLGLVEAVVAMAAFGAVWAGQGVGLEELRRLAPALLARTAGPAALEVQRLATTAALAAIVLCQMANLFACRSERMSAFRLPLGGNALLWAGLAVEAALLAAVVYLPPLQRVFSTGPLPALAWPLLLGGPFLLLAVDEAAKWRRRRAGTGAG
jgi:Ca2+-transporting ATPase